MRGVFLEFRRWGGRGMEVSFLVIAMEGLHVWLIVHGEEIVS